MDTASRLMWTIWGAMAAFAQQVEASHWFPLLVGAAALSVLLGIVNFMLTVAHRPSGDRRPLRILWIELQFLVTDELLPIVCLWFAFATPNDRLPFAPPSPTDHWLFLPAHTTYIVIAVLAHGVLSLWGTIFLTMGWLTQLRTPDNSRTDVTLVTLALLAMVWVWEAQGWPELFLISFELILSLIVAILAGAWAVGPRRLVAFTKPETTKPQRYATVRLYLSVFVITWTLSLFFIVLWHQIDWFMVALAALYFVLTLLDLIVMTCFDTSSYRRAFILFPLTLVLTFFAASGMLRPLTHNSSLNYSLWLDVGVATAVYMLLFPLTEMARRAVRQNLRQQAEQQSVVIASNITESILSLGSKSPPESPLLPADAKVVDSSPSSQTGSSDKRVQPSRDGQHPAQRPAEGSVVFGILTPANSEALKKRAEVVYNALNGRVWIILLVATLIFHYFEGFPDVLAGLGGNLLTVVFGVLSLFAGLFALLASKDNDPARNVLLLVLMLAMGVIAGDIMLNYVPIASGTVAAPPASLLAVLHDQHYILATLHSICQELLALLAVGQIAYLVIVVNANLRNYEAELNDA